MNKHLECPHYEESLEDDRQGSYIYEISKGTDLMLCGQCHLNLAQELMQQIVVEALVK